MCSQEVILMFYIDSTIISNIAIANQFIALEEVNNLLIQKAN